MFHHRISQRGHATLLNEQMVQTKLSKTPAELIPTAVISSKLIYKSIYQMQVYKQISNVMLVKWGLIRFYEAPWGACKKEFTYLVIGLVVEFLGWV